MGKKLICLTSVFLALGPAVANAQGLQPVGWWRLDETSGTTAADASGNANHGSVMGGAQWIEGQVDGALRFDGSDDYVDLPIGSLISTLTDSTFAVWADFSNSGGSWQRIFDFGTGTTVNMFLTPRLGTTGQLRFAITTAGNAAESLITAPETLPSDWHHVAVVINAESNNMQLYLDGEVVASGSTQTLPADLGSTNQNWLGRSQYAADGYYNGALDDFRIYDRVLSQEEIEIVMKGGGYGTAAGPDPVNEGTDVPREAILSWLPGPFAATHDVYLGTSFEDVNDADRTNPLEVLVSRGQDANAYDPPGRLELGQTYYWRIDEVNAAPDETIFEGEVWSFTVEPFSYPVENITATASSSNNENMGPEKTIDGSGLSENDEHSTTAEDMWLSAKGASEPAWIQYTFDKTYKLDQMWVWNSNQALETILGIGARDVTVEYSTDGAAWTVLDELEFVQAPGLPTYTADTRIDFGGVAARSVRLTISSNWGDLLAQYGLSEVRFFYHPVSAREPDPAAGATEVNPQLSLGWRPGREAASHQVYLSTDEQAVIDGTALLATVAEPWYEVAIDLDESYFWKVTEVNEAEVLSTWEGDVWSFSTAAYVVVDDFESYDDDWENFNRIFQVWIDGAGYTEPAPGHLGNGSGSLVGTSLPPWVEEDIVHSGGQSMPLLYDNTGGASYSEAERTFDEPQDWTQHGVTTLVVHFRGDPDNAAAPLYVKLNGTKVLYNEGAAVTALPVWKQWNIDLASLSAEVDLTSIRTLAIGVGNGPGGGTGTIYIDDILLYQSPPEVIAPADPGSDGLVVHYAMEGNVQDSSGRGNHGEIFGDSAYEAGPGGLGQVLSFNGTNTYVGVPVGSLLGSLRDMTVAVHVDQFDATRLWQRLFDFGTGTTTYMFLTPNNGTTSTPRFAITTSGGGANESLVSAPSALWEGWHHVAVVIDSAGMTLRLYVDGELAAEGATQTLPSDLGVTTQNWLGRSQYEADPYFMGLLDEFRIYDRALSASEIRYLAGDR